MNTDNKELFQEIKDLLIKCKGALEYAAYNIDGSKLDNLRKNMVDSTGVSDTALLAARDIEQFLEKIPARLRVAPSLAHTDTALPASDKSVEDMAVKFKDWCDENYAEIQMDEMRAQRIFSNKELYYSFKNSFK